MAYFNDPTYNLTTSTCGNNNIDVLNLEYEFWNPDGYYYFGTNPGADPNRTLQDKLLYMDLTKTLYNSSHTDKLYTELYLGTLDDDWSNGSGTFDNHCKIAEYLDGMYNATDRRIDRFVTTYYSFYYVNLYNPGGMGSLDQNYEYRYADFCEENNSYVSSAQCSTPIITNNNTDIHPLFSAEDPFKGAEKGSVFLGNYLGARSDQNITGTYSEQNIFSAERSLQKYTSPSQLFTLSNN